MAKQPSLREILEAQGFKLDYEGATSSENIRDYFEQLRKGEIKGFVVLPVNTRWIKGYATYVKLVKKSGR